MLLKRFALDRHGLSIEDAYVIACQSVEVFLSGRQCTKFLDGRQFLEYAVEHDVPIYGVKTGYREMVSYLVGKKYETELRHNLIRSYATRVGTFPLKKNQEQCFIHSLAKGYSAARKVLVDRMIFYLNHQIVPVIPEIGSLGASGDLAFLSHLALTLIGEGFVFGQEQLEAAY